MKMLKVIVLLVFVVFVIDFKLVAEETITNETIVTMVKAGLGEELIMSKIQASQSQSSCCAHNTLKR